MMCSFHNDDRMLPTAGLQTSQPNAFERVPAASMMAVIVFSFLILEGT